MAIVAFYLFLLCLGLTQVDSETSEGNGVDSEEGRLILLVTEVLKGIEKAGGPAKADVLNDPMFKELSPRLQQAIRDVIKMDLDHKADEDGETAPRGRGGRLGRGRGNRRGKPRNNGRVWETVGSNVGEVGKDITGKVASEVIIDNIHGTESEP